MNIPLSQATPDQISNALKSHGLSVTFYVLVGGSNLFILPNMDLTLNAFVDLVVHSIKAVGGLLSYLISNWVFVVAFVAISIFAWIVMTKKSHYHSIFSYETGDKARVSSIHSNLKAKYYKNYLHFDPQTQLSAVTNHSDYIQDYQTKMNYSMSVVLFLNEAYEQRVNTPGTVIHKEFQSALSLGTMKVIIVVLGTGRMRNPNLWADGFLKNSFPNPDLIFCQNEYNENEIVNRLMNRINQLQTWWSWRLW